MTESFLISLREGFEAALVISILLGCARRLADPRATRWIWIGTASALVVAAVSGIVLHLVIGGLSGVARSRTFGVTCLASAGLLTWMIVWMSAHGRTMKADLEARTTVVGSGAALVAVAFTAVVREGLETALFLLSTTASSDGASVALGTVLGLVAACALGVAIYRGSAKIDMRRFFRVTGFLIILFAAGLMAKSVLFFQVAGDLGSIHDPVWDVTGVRWLTTASQVGRFLAGIFGWDPRPSLEQVAAYVVCLVAAAALAFRPRGTVAPDAAAAPRDLEVTGAAGR